LVEHDASGPAAHPTTESSMPQAPASADAAYLHNPAPVYPPLSRRRGEEGRVVLRVRVLDDGSAATVEIATGSGYPRLDNAARETVRNWRFVPARRGDARIDSWLNIPIVFRLED
jgi:protein TonB